MATNKSYPKTRFDIVDQTAIKTIPVSEVKNPMPLAIQTFTSDKGSEEWKVYDNFDKFLNETGAINYQKHGQPQLTVAEILRSGGAVLAKRLVEKDATFAQKTICANIATLVIPDEAAADSTVNEVVNLRESFRSNKKSFLYYSVVDTPFTNSDTITDAASKKTVTELFNLMEENAIVTNSEITRKLPYLKRVNAGVVEGVTTYTDLGVGDPNKATDAEWNIESEDSNVSFNVKTYPLFTICAIGRGKSNLWFTIEPNTTEYSTKKSDEIRIFKYIISIYDSESNSNEVLERFKFSLHPDASTDGVNLSLDSRLLNSNQVRCAVYEQNLNTFMNDLVAAIGDQEKYPKSEIISRDVLCGRLYNQSRDYMPNIITSSKNTEGNVKYFNVTRTDTTTTTGEEPETTTTTTSTYERSINNSTDAPTYNLYNIVTDTITNIIDFTETATIKLDNGTGCNDNTYVKINNGCTTYTVEYKKMLKAAFGSVINEDDSLHGTARETYPERVEHDLSLEQYESIVNDTSAGGTTASGTNYIDNEYAKYLFSSEIYDLDKYKIDFTFDNNYPMDVKHIIIDLTEYRGDMVFLCDLGFDLTTLKAIKEAKSTLDGNDNAEYTSKFVAVYHNSCKVLNPYTSKQIRVTMPFVMIPVFVDHLENAGVGYAFAGMVNNMVFPNIIPGSINYIPVDVPVGSQKQQLVNMNVNYLSYYGSLPVMDTMYVNQSQYTQLSFLHNIIAIQGIIKKIREACPRSRYTFLNSGDLQNYINDVSALLNEYATYFDKISVQYMADEQYEENNIFYATLTVKCKNFIQEEYFRIIAIN